PSQKGPAESSASAAGRQNPVPSCFGYTLFAARMKLLVGDFQVFRGDMGINLGRGKVGMPKEKLKRSQVHPGLKQVGCEGMANHVGRNRLFDAGLISQ